LIFVSCFAVGSLDLVWRDIGNLPPPLRGVMPCRDDGPWVAPNYS
jgi:hypothetical protein